MNRLKQSLSSLPTPALPSFGSGSTADSERAAPPPLDTDRLVQLKARRKVAKELDVTFASFLEVLAKQRSDPRSGGTASARPSRWLGETMVEGAAELEQLSRGDTALETYCHALSSVGELHLRLANLSTEYTDTLAVGFLTSLEGRVKEHKQFKEAMKEAEKKRSALEVVMTKAEKSKKDPSEAEYEVEQASNVYENECDFLARKADALDGSIVRDIEDLKQLVEDQLAYAQRYVELLEQCKASLPSTASLPTTRSRSSSLQVPTVPTRMARSHSDSSVRGVSISSSATSLFSSLGPNRSRRSTVSSQTSDKDKKDSGENSSKSRSRSGSVLERFALGNKGKKKDASSPSTPAENGEERDEREPGSPSGPVILTPSRSGSSKSSMPGLPTLASLKKLATTPGGSYGSLDDDEREPAPSSPSSSRPPLFKRTQTAPAASSATSSFGGSAGSGSPRRAVPPLPPSLPARNGPVGKTYRAQWAYKPSAGAPSDDDDEEEEELPLAQGDVVRVEREVNSDWWVGFKVGAGVRKERGMFPSAYVVSCADPEEGQSGEGRGVASESRWTNFGNGSSDRFSSTAGDTTDEDDGDRGPNGGLLGQKERPATLGSSGGAPLAMRRTAPRPPASRSRSTTLVAQSRVSEEDEGSNPFGEDSVSFAEARGQMSR
ncbi:hypothetical protein JCM11251_007857 [Rhodosporidiobolus azoricus]